MNKNYDKWGTNYKEVPFIEAELARIKPLLLKLT
jgi:hypothetical protein